MSKYQLMPPLSDDDYQALKNDIANRGVIVAVEYDDRGQIIDGFHRVRACKELKIIEWPRNVRAYEDEAAKRTMARKLNLARRHLDAKTKRALIAEELKDNPDRSDRQVAMQLGVSHVTVGKARRKSESTGQIDQLKKRTGKDGKRRKQPASRPKRDAAPTRPKYAARTLEDWCATFSVQITEAAATLSEKDKVELFEHLKQAINELRMREVA
jgi:ParB-like chromosome segregation protein Spo0J